MWWKIGAVVSLATFGGLSASAGAWPLSHPVVGPMLLCFKYSTFQLLEGEQVSDFSGVGEDMSIQVEGPSGSYRIGEGEVWAAVRGSKRRVLTNGGTEVYRINGSGRYAIYGPGFSKKEHRPLIWLTGAALNGTKNDAAIFSRFEVRDTSAVDCKQTFLYGWNFGAEGE